MSRQAQGWSDLKPWKVWALTAGLFLVVVGIALFAGEVFVRLMREAWPFEYAMAIPSHVEHRELRWLFPPKEGMHHLGLRNIEVGDKAPNVTRILFLGDSLIFSGETSSARLYTEVIEDRLNDRLGTPQHRFQVINAGIPGYTTHQELLFLRLHGLDMQPDVVVLGFVFNDLLLDYLHRPTSTNLLEPDAESLLHRFDTERLPGRLFARSLLAHELYWRGHVIWQIISGQPGYAFERRRDFYLAWTEQGWRRTPAQLQEMRELVEQHGAKFRIIIFPIREQMAYSPDTPEGAYVFYPQRRIAAICETLQLSCLDLTSVLLQGGGKKLFRDGLHLKGPGNDIVADVVARALLADGALAAR